MTRIGDAVHNRPPHAAGEAFHVQADAARAHHELLRGLDGKQVCPFCGSVTEKTGAPCQRCGMDNTPDARKATKARIGPWYVLQARNPAAPGMRFETLLSFVRKGRVRARSVVRGPTTHQLWRFAAHVKGLSREFGLCFSCGSAIETTANICPQCNRLQEPPINPDMLLEDGEGVPAAAAAPAPDASRAIYRELPEPSPAVSAPAPAAPPPAPEDVDIVIPALGGFGPEDLDAAYSSTPPVVQPGSSSSSSSVFAGASVASSPFTQPSAQNSRSTPLTPSVQMPPASSPRRPQQPPADENPFAIAPPRKKGNGDASFLSARELAAAFKLSFDPSATMDAIDVPDTLPASALPEGMRPSAVMSPRNMGTLAAPGPRPAQQQQQRLPADAPKRGGGGGFRRFVLFVLILAATGFAVLMWVDPAVRTRTVEWCKATYAKLHAYGSGDGERGGNPAATAPSEFDIPDPPASTPTVPSVTSTPSSSAASAAKDEPEAPADVTTPSEPASPGETDRPSVAADADARPASAGPAEAPAPPPVAKNRATVTAPASRPAAKSPPEPAAAEAKAEARPGESDAEAAMRLFRQGIAAERARDYKAAVAFYEQAKKFPPPWPGGLEVRLNAAKAMLKK